MNPQTPSTQNQGMSRFQNGLAAAETAAGFFGMPVEALLRYDFGERYFSLLGLYGKLATYALFLGLAGIAADHFNSPGLALFFVASFASCLWHQFRIWQRKKQGKPWHSRYAGTSHLASVLPLSRFVIQRWVEPSLCLLAGTILCVADPPLGLYLLFAGLCIAATETLAEARFNTRILDAMDADIEARNLRAAILEAKDAKETEGFVIPVGGLSLNQRTGIFSSLARTFETMMRPADRPQPLPPVRFAPCPRCRASNVEDAVYCGNCRASLRAAPASSPPATSPPWPQPAPKPS